MLNSPKEELINPFSLGQRAGRLALDSLGSTLLNKEGSQRWHQHTEPQRLALKMNLLALKRSTVARNSVGETYPEFRRGFLSPSLEAAYRGHRMLFTLPEGQVQLPSELRELYAAKARALMVGMGSDPDSTRAIAPGYTLPQLV